MKSSLNAYCNIFGKSAAFIRVAALNRSFTISNELTAKIVSMRRRRSCNTVGATFLYLKDEVGESSSGTHFYGFKSLH